MIETKQEIFDCIVIGGGIAGLTAGLYLAYSCTKVLVFERELFGGKLNYIPTVENYAGFSSIKGKELSQKIYSQVSKLGITKYAEVIKAQLDGKIKKIYTDKGIYFAKSVIIAIGSQPRTLEGFENENFTYCELCDGHFFKGENIAIVGGGNSAFECAKYMKDIAKKVHLLIRSNQARADLKLVKDISTIKNCFIHYNTKLLSIHEDVKKIEILENSKARTLNCARVFLKIGYTFDNSLFPQLKSDNNGFSIVTGIPGVYVAGDCKSSPIKQLVTAASDGAIAAIIARKFLSGIDNSA